MVASKKDTEARQWNIRKASKAFTIPPFSPNDPSSNPWSENPFILPETRFPRPARCKFSYFPLRMQFSKSMSPSAIFTCAILSNLSILDRPEYTRIPQKSSNNLITWPAGCHSCTRDIKMFHTTRYLDWNSPSRRHSAESRRNNKVGMEDPHLGLSISVSLRQNDIRPAHGSRRLGRPISRLNPWDDLSSDTWCSSGIVSDRKGVQIRGMRREEIFFSPGFRNSEWSLVRITDLKIYSISKFGFCLTHRIWMFGIDPGCGEFFVFRSRRGWTALQSLFPFILQRLCLSSW